MTTDASLLQALRDAARSAGVVPTRVVLPENHYAHLNGVRLHYLDWGNEHLPHVVLLHGDALQAHTWDLAALLLRDHYHLVALSLRGHGDSGWTPASDLERDRFDLLLEDTRAFIDHLGFSAVTLVGQSLGGLTALRFAAHYPEPLTALVLVDAAPELGLAELARQQVAPQVLDTFEAFAEGAQRLLPNRPPAQLRYSLLHALKQLPNGGWTWKRDPRPSPALSHAAHAAQAAALWQDARSIRQPTLLLRGERSRVLAPGVAERVVEEMQNARLVVIPGAGHNLHGDAPTEFAHALHAFLQPLSA